MLTFTIWAGRTIYVLARLGLYISIGLLIAAFVQKNSLPTKEEISPELYQEPLQYKVYRAPLNIEAGGQEYEVKPLYGYELKGLVVSQHDATAWWDYYHRKWGDTLNLKDVCVIWGDNLEDETYRRMRFRNGSWTCYISVNAATADKDWSQFNMAALSNNHLLSDSSEINRLLRNTQVGDQIHLKGYLASYSRKESNFNRGSSTSRIDQGDGACETIYLTDFKILKKANISWWQVYNFSKFLVVLFFIFIIFLRFKSPLGGF